MIAEYNSTGGLVQKYVHGAVIDEILVKTQGTTDAFYHHDALGSTVLLTNTSGNIVRSYEYDAFGKVSNPPSVDNMFSSDPYANRFLYTGREFLQEANLYDYRNRVYSAELGRFLQSDPIRFDVGDATGWGQLLTLDNPKKGSAVKMRQKSLEGRMEGRLSACPPNLLADIGRAFHLQPLCNPALGKRGSGTDCGGQQHLFPVATGTGL